MKELWDTYIYIYIYIFLKNSCWMESGSKDKLDDWDNMLNISSMVVGVKE